MSRKDRKKQKKILRLKRWLETKHENAIDCQDYTREMAYREVMRKVNDLIKEQE